MYLGYINMSIIHITFSKNTGVIESTLGSLKQLSTNFRSVILMLLQLY